MENTGRIAPYSKEYAIGNGAVGHALSGERAFDRQVAEAVAKRLPPPQRPQGQGIYGRPAEGAEIFDINAGE